MNLDACFSLKLSLLSVDYNVPGWINLSSLKTFKNSLYFQQFRLLIYCCLYSKICEHKPKGSLNSLMQAWIHATSFLCRAFL